MNFERHRMNRRELLQGAAAVAAGTSVEGLLNRSAFAQNAGSAYTSKRPAKAQRKFVSQAVEAKIAEVKGKIRNPELAWLFENCYPNTLDTTVEFDQAGGDTFVITGDIAAMWLRDSTAQTTPYLSMVKEDERLRAMFRGLLGRQAHCILLDPYANAFYKGNQTGDWKSDETDMKPGVHERKWEIDSVCYPIRLASLYWEQTHDATAFNDRWQRAAHRIVETLQVQQRLHGDGPYHFGRKTSWFYDNAPNNGLGNPSRKVGLIHSAFRPSDDSCFYPFLIPSNFFAKKSMEQLALLATEAFHDAELSQSATALAAVVGKALDEYASAEHPQLGRVYAYEVDGFGNHLWMDDSNCPSLLALPYMGCCELNDPMYQRTRKLVLGQANPYYEKGSLAEGVGSPHTGPGMIWHLSIIFRALTTEDEAEMQSCLSMLVKTHAGTGFLHESFDPNNPSKYTRPWFAWCNSIFGELVVKLADKHPQVLAAV